MILLKMFPKHHFILWDPNKFAPSLHKHNRVETHNDFFTDEVAQRYKDGKYLFISDIRLTPEEEQVFTDMLMQQSWVNIIGPKAFMLKFRPPWDNKPLEYLQGKIMYQPYAPIASSETRLIASSPDGRYDTITYRVENYDGWCFYHNSIMRNWAHYDNNYGLDAKNQAGRNNGWDCTAELEILRYYCEHFNADINDVLGSINQHLMGKNVRKLDPVGLGKRNPCLVRRVLYRRNFKEPAENSTDMD